jgi:membrane protein implicated in regulation of membrane protease activity
MYLVLIAWMYVAVMMAVAEATATNGSLIGAIVTFVLYGVLPVAILGYILGTPARKARLREQNEAADAAAASPGSTQSNGGDHAPGAAQD